MIIGLQFLRFVAAALVVLNHAMGEVQGLAPFGAVGVDIFFVLSGFIISFITETSRDHFLVRRLIRIAPQYWFFTATLALVAIAAPSLLRTARFDGTHFVASLLFIPYWTPSNAFSPLLKLGWTLNFEMFFYLVFFLAMKISLRHRELVCSGLLMLVYAIASQVDIDPKSPLFFYRNSIIFEFVFGMGLAVLYRSGRIASSSRATLSAAYFIGILLFLYALTYWRVDGLPRVILWGLPAFVLVWVVLRAEAAFQRFSAKVKGWIVMAGDISYPLYLIHIYFIAVLSRVLRSLNLSWPAVFVVALFTSSIASLLVLRFFDVPLRGRMVEALRNRTRNRRITMQPDAAPRQ